MLTLFTSLCFLFSVVVLALVFPCPHSFYVCDKYMSVHTVIWRKNELCKWGYKVKDILFVVKECFCSISWFLKPWIKVLIPWLQGIFAILPPPYLLPEPVWDILMYVLSILRHAPIFNVEAREGDHYALNLFRQSFKLSGKIDWCRIRM